ncbi:unnamed protein product [Mytilus coruscus]|uniref:Uncharacterized protein n=1 Tax=Mytilus coruscus TaxID=42192 RepID=A0A6J8EQ99_MYTCO|nr:unnamed protein product [Mytilus coruscus]
MYEASLNIGEQHSLFSNDLILGKFKAVVNNECKNSIAAFFVTNVDEINSVYALNWIIYNGQKLVKNRCEIAFGDNNILPEFGTLKDIWMTIENNTQRIYFVFEMFETIEYREDVQGFKIRKPGMAQGFELIRIQNIFLHVPLHAYFACDNFFYLSSI